MGARPQRKHQSSSHTAADPFAKFDSLNGDHPWMKQMPDGYVAYRVRELGIGEVTYFNFALAKEMGLIDDDHPQLVTRDLKEKILKTFSLQIINEYDELTHRKFTPETIKPHPFMA